VDAAFAVTDLGRRHDLNRDLLNGAYKATQSTGRGFLLAAMYNTL
jgi:hypothetical protein